MIIKSGSPRVERDGTFHEGSILHLKLGTHWVINWGLLGELGDGQHLEADKKTKSEEEHDRIG